MNTVSRFTPASSAARPTPPARITSATAVLNTTRRFRAEVDSRVFGCDVVAAYDIEIPTPSKHRGSSLDALLTHVETGWSVIASAG